MKKRTAKSFFWLLAAGALILGIEAEISVLFPKSIAWIVMVIPPTWALFYLSRTKRFKGRKRLVKYIQY
jgi:hypothetical protein